MSVKKKERQSQEEDKEKYKEVEKEEIEKVDYQEKVQNIDSTLVSQIAKNQDIVPLQDQHTIAIEKLIMQVPEVK